MSVENQNAHQHLDPNIRTMAELLYSEVQGRIHACGLLEDEARSIGEPDLQYGFSLATQELLLRTAEASLKLLYLLHFNKPSGRIHSLKDLWDAFPGEVQKEVEAIYRDMTGFDEGLNFAKYDINDFQQARYPYEYLVQGQQIGIEPQSLILDCYAVLQTADKWLGAMPIWPWAGRVEITSNTLRVPLVEDGKVWVWIRDRDNPAEFRVAVIEETKGHFTWTLFYGFTDKTGRRRVIQIPREHYIEHPSRPAADSVGLCAAMIYSTCTEPKPDLVRVMQAIKDTT